MPCQKCNRVGTTCRSRRVTQRALSMEVCLATSQPRYKSTNHLHSPPLNKKRHDGRIQGSLDGHLTSEGRPDAINDAQKPPAYDGILVRGRLYPWPQDTRSTTDFRLPLRPASIRCRRKCMNMARGHAAPDLLTFSSKGIGKERIPIITIHSHGLGFNNH